MILPLFHFIGAFHSMPYHYLSGTVDKNSRIIRDKHEGDNEAWSMKLHVGIKNYRGIAEERNTYIPAHDTKWFVQRFKLPFKEIHERYYDLDFPSDKIAFNLKVKYENRMVFVRALLLKTTPLEMLSMSSDDE